MEAATMPTVCLRFRFEEHPRIRALMEACADIQRQAVDYALENGKTATFTLIQALYPSLRAQHPDLHANLIYGAIRSGARVVHGFRNQQRKGKTRADRPEIRRPSIYLVRQTVKIEWDGETLTVTIPVSPRDPEPIVLTFRPHHKYRRLLDEWKAGRARMGEPTLTAHSLSIPLKFPDPTPYKPDGVIGIDSNEGNLTAFATSTGEIREIDTSYVGKVNRDHLRREIKGTRGKQNPKARKKIASKHGRIRQEKTENFWHHLALALIAWVVAPLSSARWYHRSQIPTEVGPMNRKPHSQNPPCPRCGATHVIKNGSKGGRPRWVCRNCGRSFGPTLGTAMYRLRATPTEVARTLLVVMRRGSLSAAEEITGHKVETIRRWLRAAARHAEALTEVLVHDLHLSEVEVDAFWSFVKKSVRRLEIRTPRRAGWARVGDV
jgi:transposase-like protein